MIYFTNSIASASQTQQDKHQNPPNSEDQSFLEALRIQQEYDREDAELREQIKHLNEEEQLSIFECGICFDQVLKSDVARADGCEHELCRECMRGHVSSKIQERQYPILCPLCQVSKVRKGKEGVIGELAIMMLGVSEEEFTIFEELQMIQFSVPVQCRRCKNTVYIDREEFGEAKNLNCPLPGCTYQWCKMCQQEIIPGVDHSCDGTKEFDALIKTRNWKKCPVCTTPIERISGCNRMVCSVSGCNTNFCYDCGGAIEQPYRGQARLAHPCGPCLYGRSRVA